MSKLRCCIFGCKYRVIKDEWKPDNGREYGWRTIRCKRCGTAPKLGIRIPTNL